MWLYCVMAKEAIIRARVDQEQLEKAENITSTLGISIPEAINAFLAQINIHQGIPFLLTTQPRLDLTNATIQEIEERYKNRILNNETKTTLTKNTKTLSKFHSTKELLKDLKA